MKNKNKVQIKALFPGQEVSVMGFREYGRVIERQKEKVLGNTVYKVSCEGKEFNIVRRQLGVRVNGIFKFGPHNTTDLPA
jgi:hypothetical protein